MQPQMLENVYHELGNLVKSGFVLVPQCQIQFGAYTALLINKNQQKLSINRSASGCITVTYDLDPAIYKETGWVRVWNASSPEVLSDVIRAICEEQPTASDIAIREFTQAGWRLKEADVGQDIPKKMVFKRGNERVRITLYPEVFFVTVGSTVDLIDTRDFNAATQSGDFIRYLKDTAK